MKHWPLMIKTPLGLQKKKKKKKSSKRKTMFIKAIKIVKTTTIDIT